MYCCLKKKKEYKTSSIPIVNTDGLKKKKKKNLEYKGCGKKKKKLIFIIHSEMWLKRRNLKAPKISA